MLKGCTCIPPMKLYCRTFASARVKEVQRRFDILQRERMLNAEKGNVGSTLSNDDARLTDAVDASVLEEIDSSAAIVFLKNNWSNYESIDRKRHDTISKLKSYLTPEPDKCVHDIQRPLSAEYSLKVLSSVTKEESSVASGNESKPVAAEQLENKIVVDSGFFVRTDGLVDEYTSGGADELPEDEMNEELFEIHGFEEGKSVEQIDFQRPGQNACQPKTLKNALEEVRKEAPTEMLSNYGKEGNYFIPPLQKSRCSACGAQFHCNNTSLPGFVPVEMFGEIARNERLRADVQRTDYLCRRCYLYKEYKFLLNVNVCEVDYYATMGHLKLIEEALILLVVDMADLECSIHQDLPNIIGEGKPMIVVGNKIDLLPPDANHGYLKHYQLCLKNAVANAGFTDKFNILKHSLVSAKTGFGMEDLVTSIFTKWVSPRGSLRSNIYVLGCTNAGKSTLFNAFLQSDLCKVQALDLVERVTTSIWPGTTLSLLKFPMWNPSSYKLEQRRRRILEYQKWSAKEALLMSNLYKSTGDPKYITLQGCIDNTFKDAAKETEFNKSARKMSGEFFGELNKMEDKSEKNSKINLNNTVFTNGNWCYDTPGTVNRQQILDLLTLEELINVIPRTMILPRNFLVYPGDSLLIGGISRVDVVSAKAYDDENAALYLTVFASDRLPIQHMPTKDVDIFLKQYSGTKILQVPFGDSDRLKLFPKLKYRKFFLKNNATDRHSDSFADIMLSSVGWISVTSFKADDVELHAWTPEARGLLVRAPMLRKPSLLRGKRIAGTNAYMSALPFTAEKSIYQRGRIIHQPIEMVEVRDRNEPKVNHFSMKNVSFDIL